MPLLVAPTRRRSVRRGVRARCQAVRFEGFRLVGERILDLSTRGALLACDAPVEPGERLLLSFRCPNGGPWIDADVEVGRVVHGWRTGDPGYCAGVRFVELALESRHEILVRLAGLPPPIPAGRLRTGYVRAASV